MVHNCHSCFFLKKKEKPRLICQLHLLCKHNAPKPISTTQVMFWVFITKFFYCIQLSHIFIDGHCGFSCQNHSRLYQETTLLFKKKNSLCSLTPVSISKCNMIILKIIMLNTSEVVFCLSKQNILACILSLNCKINYLFLTVVFLAQEWTLSNKNMFSLVFQPREVFHYLAAQHHQTILTRELVPYMPWLHNSWDYYMKHRATFNKNRRKIEAQKVNVIYVQRPEKSLLDFCNPCTMLQ